MPVYDKQWRSGFGSVVMQYRRFGQTELQMPVLTCGGMRFQKQWKDCDFSEIEAAGQANLEATVRYAFEIGANHFETARGYGTSEMQLGKILPSLPRDEIIVQTKVGPTEDAQEFLDHFETSLGYLNLDETQTVIGRQLIGSIESDGYIRRDLDAIINDLAFSLNIEIDFDELEEVLIKIQNFEPPGIAARNLKECLLIQLGKNEEPDIDLILAKKIVSKCFDEFTKKHYDKITKKLSIDDFPSFLLSQGSISLVTSESEFTLRLLFFNLRKSMLLTSVFITHNEKSGSRDLKY